MPSSIAGHARDGQTADGTGIDIRHVAPVRMAEASVPLELVSSLVLVSVCV